MATEFCQRCKKAHPGRTCDYDEKGDCSETPKIDDVADESNTQSEDSDKQQDAD